MKKNYRKPGLKTEVLHDHGQIKIRVTTSTKRAFPRQIPIHFAQCREVDYRIVNISAKKQPTPVIPGLTKKMVCEHIPKLIEGGLLERKPKSLPEWLLAEWHVARDLNLTRLRLAHFVSEILCKL